MHQRVEDTWAHRAYLKASNTGTGDHFGAALAFDGNTIAVGAPEEDSNARGQNGNGSDDSATDSGAVYVFSREGSSWRQTAYLKAPDSQAGAEFGSSLALDGDRLIVGAPWHDTTGAVYSFTRSADAWSLEAKLLASNADPDDKFGAALAMEGETLVVGAPGEASIGKGKNADASNDSAGGAGAVYVFEWSTGVWLEQAYLKASNTRFSTRFGQSLFLSNGRLAVGSPLEDRAGSGVAADDSLAGANFSGAVYLFERLQNGWEQTVYIKSSNSGAGDRFGWSLVLTEDSLVVGASFEDSASSGPNGNQSDDSATNSGAVYVFLLSQGQWRQVTYLKASNTSAQDGFGMSLAVSGNTLVVASPREGGMGTGPGADEQAVGVLEVGAVYVFR